MCPPAGWTRPQGPLGSFLPPASSSALSSSTKFASAQFDWLAAPHLAVSGQASIGQSQANGQQIQLRQGAAISSSWRLGLQTLCPAARLDCVRLTAQIDQPIRIESGVFTADLADAFRPARTISIP